MRRPFEKLGILFGLILTLTWPMLLGVAIAGRQGLSFAILVYAAFVILFLVLLLLGGIRGILSA